MQKSSTQEKLEALYGLLGEAQIEQLQKEIHDNPGFLHYAPSRQWSRINQLLSADDYKQKTPTYDMDDLLEYEKRFTSGDIFIEDVSEVDMNSLMDLYEKDGEHGF